MLERFFFLLPSTVHAYRISTHFRFFCFYYFNPKVSHVILLNWPVRNIVTRCYASYSFYNWRRNMVNLRNVFEDLYSGSEHRCFRVLIIAIVPNSKMTNNRFKIYLLFDRMTKKRKKKGPILIHLSTIDKLTSSQPSRFIAHIFKPISHLGLPQTEFGRQF